MLCVSTEPTLNNCKPYLYSGKNVVEFYRHLQQEQEELDCYLRTNLPMEPLTPKKQQRHNDAIECEQCHKPFENTRAMRKVRHQMHLIGKYAMSVCSSCNLQLKPRICSICLNSEHELKKASPVSLIKTSCVRA